MGCTHETTIGSGAAKTPAVGPALSPSQADQADRIQALNGFRSNLKTLELLPGQLLPSLR